MWVANAPEGALLVADTALSPEERIPAWIIEGYPTLFWEIEDELCALGEPPPDLAMVQIGVGSLASFGGHSFPSPKPADPAGACRSGIDTALATPGHWATGERDEIARNRGAGYVYAHCVVDDHSRLAYVELHGADTGHAAAVTLHRAAAWMRQQGAGPTEVVMTDNAFIYRHSHQFRAVLDELGARHIRTPPYTAHRNRKAERFIHTLDHEWAHGRVWPNSTRRDRGLASWLRYYNRRRPHTSLSDQPPISRLHQDRGHDN